MIILIITLHLAAATMVAMVFEWMWEQKLVPTKPKSVMCKTYWMVLCVAAFVCASPLPILTIPVLAGVGLVHLDLVRRAPSITVTPRTLISRIPQLLGELSRKVFKT